MGRAARLLLGPFSLLGLAAVAQIRGEGAAVGFGLLLFLTGVAHGAGDEQGGAIRPFRLVGAVAYIVAGLAVAALFVAFPLAGLTLFLLLSAWHFAHSSGESLARRLGFALSAIGGSALWRMAETAAVFEAALGVTPPQGWMVALAAIGSAGLLLTAWSLAKSWRDTVLWSTIIATAFLHPVLAVGLAFAAGHALPIQQAQIRRHGWRDVLAAEGPTTAIALAGVLAMALLVLTNHLALPLAAALAFGMATPHMLSERLER